MHHIDTPADFVAKVLEAAGEHLILIGGQALAFWMSRYEVPTPEYWAAITGDTDFLTDSAGDDHEVIRLARMLGGVASVPDPTELTALVGQVIKDIPGKGTISIDVVFKVHGANVRAVKDGAVTVEENGVKMSVMHPLHVLKSRVDNLYSLPDKQQFPEKAEMQLTCAIQVASAFLQDIAQNLAPQEKDRSIVLNYVELIGNIARSDAGRKVAQRHGIHVADAIEPSLVENAPFQEIRKPQLMELMSIQRQEEVKSGLLLGGPNAVDMKVGPIPLQKAN